MRARAGETRGPPALERVAAAKRADGTFRGSGGARLYWCCWRPERSDPSAPVCVVLHGYGEHCRAYEELANYLVAHGVTVCGFDARGHGRSSGQRGYTDRFERYVDDLELFLQRARERLPRRPIALTGHSNGALTVVRALQRGVPGVNRAVLVSPILKVHSCRRAVPDWAAGPLSRWLGRLPLPSNVSAHELISDREKAHARVADPWMHRWATPRWYWTMVRQARQARLEVDRLTTPTLVILGGQDTLADPDCTRSFYGLLPASEKRLIVRPGGLHELLHGRGRTTLYRQIAEWTWRAAECHSESPSGI